MPNPKLEDGVRQQGLAEIPVAAKFLSLSRGKMYAMLQDGSIPSKRFGRSIRIPWSWLHQQAEVNDDSEVSQ